MRVFIKGGHIVMDKAKKIGIKIFVYAVMIFTIIISIFPIIWVIMSAFKTNAQILSSPFSLPTHISFDAFAYIFENVLSLNCEERKANNFRSKKYC